MFTVYEAFKLQQASYLTDNWGNLSYCVDNQSEYETIFWRWKQILNTFVTSMQKNIVSISETLLCGLAASLCIVSSCNNNIQAGTQQEQTLVQYPLVMISSSFVTAHSKWTTESSLEEDTAFKWFLDNNSVIGPFSLYLTSPR